MPIQGTLPSRFFLPELPERIQQALAPPAGAEVQTGKAGSASAPNLRERLLSGRPALMSRLAQEVGAEAVLLIRSGELVTHTGRMSENGVAALTSSGRRCLAGVHASLKFWAKSQLRFEQSIEGGEYLLYSMAIVEDLILSVVVAGKVSLGIIRHRAKETAEGIPPAAVETARMQA